MALMRREPDGKVKHALNNASPDTPLEHLAWMESQRYFVERSIQNAKPELGWDEFRARKFRTWAFSLTAALVLLSNSSCYGFSKFATAF